MSDHIPVRALFHVTVPYRRSARWQPFPSRPGTLAAGDEADAAALRSAKQKLAKGILTEAEYQKVISHLPGSLQETDTLADGGRRTNMSSPRLPASVQEPDILLELISCWTGRSTNTSSPISQVLQGTNMLQTGGGVPTRHLPPPRFEQACSGGAQAAPRSVIHLPPLPEAAPCGGDDIPCKSPAEGRVDEHQP